VAGRARKEMCGIAHYDRADVDKMPGDAVRGRCLVDLGGIAQAHILVATLIAQSLMIELRGDTVLIQRDNRLHDP
jgi:hypothetical protein